ncbi:hypothetical protein [Nocardioides speluncae]|uniref:hypothetical protein n=1 Tax=Nocardioides speluncae TaxID=2670337 RepID=UPI000D69B30D|nr:hypothetical protein [Nocardioides speluncae]
MRTPRTCWRGYAGSLLVIALVLSGCSGDDKNDKSDDKPTPTPTPTAEAPAPVAVDARIGVVRGRLRSKQRTPLVKDVAKVVDDWFEAAYLAGSYPRRDFGAAFPGFTAGAARQAKGDRKFMSNAGIGTRIDGAEARAKVVRVDVLAGNKLPAAVTARFRLVFRTSGEYQRRITIDGRLFLTRGKERRWRIFGYDVTKGVEK